jgi:acylpyruvate hydrolase
MKIICIGRNYAEHAKEMNSDVPDKPVIFLKPDTALLKDNKPFFIPEWATNMHHETEIVYKIGKAGKYIDPQFAYKYISGISLGIDFTARDLQGLLKSKGLPWELSKAFDNSAVVGHFLQLNELKNPDNIDFHLEINGTTVQHGHSADMIFSISKIIAFVSQYFTLKTGDLIFTGTPEGVGPVHRGDILTGFIEGFEMFSFSVK